MTGDLGILGTIATTFATAIPGIIVAVVGMTLASKWKGFAVLMEIGLLWITLIIWNCCWQTATDLSKWAIPSSSVMQFIIQWIVPATFAIVSHIGSYMHLTITRRMKCQVA